MSFRGALAAVQRGGADLCAYDELARAALAEGEEESALPPIIAAAERLKAPLLWQWAGLLERSLDQHEAALQSFRRAAELAPNDAGIAHGHARVALEAGLDAVELFLRARTLAPSSGQVALGLAAARNSAGEGVLAAEELNALVERAPAWIEGHEQLAQLLSTLGEKEQATQSLERAIDRFPRQEALWWALFGIALRREDYARLGQDIARAQRCGISLQSLDFHRAIVAAELDPSLFPDLLFKVRPELDEMLGLWRIRHLLRLGAATEALPLIERELGSERAAGAWPYASIGWRLTSDERAHWLERDPSFVQVFDLAPRLPDRGELAAHLRKLHVARGEYVDQSVRGGTQTDGPLLSRIDPWARQLRAAITHAVEAYVANLPEADADHPLLSKRRDRRVRFAGSWSVNLRPGGRHANHVHPEGWISSALYVSLPSKGANDPPDAGCLTLGEPQEALKIALEPWRKIEPQALHLVLFPSWMWHGTVAFSEGERLTIAFDVRPPI